MGNNSPSRKRRDGRNTYTPGWDPRDACPYKKDAWGMEKPKYFRRKDPTIIFDRSWVEEAAEIDNYITAKYGPSAKWEQIFAFGHVAKRMYYLFKSGVKSFRCESVEVRHDHDDIYTVVALNEPITLEAI